MALALALAALGAWTVPYMGTEVQMVRVLDRAADGRAILIRSPQPSPDDLRELAREHGIKTVINLRGHEPEREWWQEEHRAAQELGLRFEHFRFSGSKPPEAEQVAAYFALVEDARNWPILVHCWGGSHRTGALSALYRIQYQGWDNERAVEEMEAFWFDWSERDRSGLKEFIRTYRPDPTRRLPGRTQARAATPPQQAAPEGP